MIYAKRFTVLKLFKIKKLFTWLSLVNDFRYHVPSKVYTTDLTLFCTYLPNIFDNL